MDVRCETRAAMAVVAAVVGTGYASGRDLVLFFAQTGRAGWIGVCVAPVLFGMLTAALCHCAAGVEANGASEFGSRLMRPRARAAAGGLYALLLALTAVVMLCGAGETGALTLPWRFGWLWGAGIALLIALLLNLSRLRALPWLGLVTLAAGVALYGALAVDPGSPRFRINGAVELALEGSWAAAILLALTYAAMNAALAAGVVLRFGRGANPGRLGACCAAALFALLATAHWAVVRGGRALLGQAMPTVVLSARWGLFGFWACAAFGYLCAVTTLAAALGGMIDLLRGGGRGATLLTALAVAVLVGALGLRGAIGTGYRAVGWLSAALMLGLACRADSLLLRGRKG